MVAIGTDAATSTWLTRWLPAQCSYPSSSRLSPSISITTAIPFASSTSHSGSSVVNRLHNVAQPGENAPSPFKLPGPQGIGGVQGAFTFTITKPAALGRGFFRLTQDTDWKWKALTLFHKHARPRQARGVFRRSIRPTRGSKNDLGGRC